MDATCSSQFAVCSWKHVANDHERQAAAAKKSKAKERTQEKTRHDRTRQANAKDNAAQLVQSTMLSKGEEKEEEEASDLCTGLAVPMFGLKQVY